MATASEKKAPHSLSTWQSALRQLELPVDPTIKSASLQKLNSSTGNAKNIAEILQGDPALCLLLMQEANKSLALSGNETHSLSHTISLLGFPRVETLIRRSAEYDKHNFVYLPQYRQQLSVSLHAAYQAVAWAKLNPYWSQDNIFWATLFHRAPEWALWYHAGDQMQQLQQHRIQRNGSSHAQSEQAIFGTNLQVLSANLSRQWHLPSHSQHSWQPSLRGNARQWIMLSHIIPEQSHIALEAFPRLLNLCSSPAFLIALANRLADEAEWDWYSPHTLRLQKILATALNRSLSDICALSHQQAADCSRQQRLARTLSPAKQLISFYRKADVLITETLKSESVTPASSTPSYAATVICAQLFALSIEQADTGPFKIKAAA